MRPDTRISRHRSFAFIFVLLIFLVSLKQTNTENATNYTTTSKTIIPSVTEPSLPSITTTPVKNVVPVQHKDNKDAIININHNHVNVSGDKLVKQVSNNSVIDLSRKNITSLTGLFPDFRTFKVQLLNLSANHLYLLPNAAFAALSSLKCLDVAENNVSLIQAQAFNNLTNLQHLNLSRNRLTSLADETFKGLSSLQQLDLSFNDLTNIAPGALELSTLTRLVLAGNERLGSNGESPLFIATGRRLQTMDATSIALEQVPSALTHSIRTLHLAENKIQIVGRGDMDSYPLLQLLDLASNKLTQVEEDALGRLEMLTILYLTDNRLSEMPHSLPERLQVLHLERNKIATLRPADLDGLTQLEVLLLSGNHIQQITDGAFVQVPNLVTLDLSQNPIFELPAGCLAGPSKLRVLRLSQLNVSMVTVEATAFPLPATEFLITLDLSGSPTVARQWLGDTAALAAARELQELDLSGCGIETLPRDTLHYLPQLRSLHLRDNTLNCSGLEWLADWMRLQEVAEYRDVHCQSPGELWGTLLVDLQSLQEVNIDEKQPKTTPPTTSKPTEAKPTQKQTRNEFAKKEVVEDIFNPPFVMNILRPVAHVTTVLPSRPRLNRIMADENDILDATIKSIIWPKAIKTVTAASSTTQTTQNIIAGISSTPPASTATHSNLFMKNSSESGKKPSQYANDHKPPPKSQDDSEIHAPNQIKSLSLTETKHQENTTGHTEASMYSYTSQPEGPKQPHPGMYLLIVGIMGATLILITLTSRMSRKSRDDLQILRAYPHDQHEGELIEVSSLPSVTELW